MKWNLVMDGSVAYSLPIKLYLLILMIVLVIALIVLIGIRSKETKNQWNNIISLIIAVLIVPTAFMLAIYQEPRYDFDYTYDFEIEIVNSSGNFDVNDFWIEVENEDAYIQKFTNGSIIYGLAEKEFESIEIQYNNTPIFWGSNSILFRSYHGYSEHLIYYQNASGAYVLHELESGFQEEPLKLYFEYGLNWIELGITIREGPVA